MSETIPLFLPEITDDDRAAVDRVLRSGRLGLGESVREFEGLFAAQVKRPHGIAVGSLGTGLRIALTACGIGSGHEVILPAFAPVVVANAVAFTGARPVFADIDPRTLNATPSTVETLVTERTRAIIASPNFGNPHGADVLAHLCTKFEIPLIENATETLGCRLGRDPAGRFGRIAVFGLPASGLVVGGDAAILVTNDDVLANTCRSLRDAGRPSIDPEDGAPPEVGRLHEHERFGFDSRMDELRGALAASQVRRIERAIEIRAKLAEHYVRRLGGHPELMLPTLPEGCTVAWPGFVIRLTETFLCEDRDLIVRGLHRHDIGASNPYPVAPLMPFHAMRWGHRLGDFPVAERMSARTIALPFHHGMGEREIDLICQTIELMIQRQTFRR